MSIDPSGGDDATSPRRHEGASRPGSASPEPITLPARLISATRSEWRVALGERAETAIERVAGREGAMITLDLRETREIDVSGLGLLVVVRRRARDRGVGVRLLHVAPAVRELLATTRLGALFDVDA